jgi:hypothetical protein
MLPASENLLSSPHFDFLHEIFETQADVYPDSIAVLFDGQETSYKQLEETKVKIQQKVDKIVSGAFQASPDQQKCGGCDFRAMCSHKSFTVGVNFKPAKSAKKESSMRSSDDVDGKRDGESDAPIQPTIVSGRTRTRAESLLLNNVTRNTDDSFQVKSGSDPSKSYRVTENKCECKGFRNYHVRHPGSVPTCSHMEAVKLFKKKKGTLDS